MLKPSINKIIKRTTWLVGQMQGYPGGVNEIKEAIKTNIEKICYPEQDLDSDFQRI